jgi:(S)-3,5-dihydroxyphenylglycine transaminase
VNTQSGTSRLAVMNFLNEVAGDFPDAISLASGRPAETFFDLDRWLQAIPLYQRELAAQWGTTYAGAGRRLAQYGRTNGLINELVAAQLKQDEGVQTSGEHVVIGAGCQEALALCLLSLCREKNDVVLARDPTYIGMTGVADLHGIDIVPLYAKDDALADELRSVIGRLGREGKRARALYLIPEFDNPTGTVLPLQVRKELLDVCAAQRVAVLEDNPYGMFRYEGERVPTMYALDRAGSVIYLFTYSKTLCPAVRIGGAVVPDTLFGDAIAARALVAELGERKSFLTVNTSQLNQALVGGILLSGNGTLAGLVSPQRDHYRKNRDLLLSALSDEFSDNKGIRWNRPEGGFFLTMDLPFRFARQEVLRCAREQHVIPMPLSFFSLSGICQESIRLAFSNVEPALIAEGVARLGRFVRQCQASCDASGGDARQAAVPVLEAGHS